MTLIVDGNECLVKGENIYARLPNEMLIQSRFNGCLTVSILREIEKVEDVEVRKFKMTNAF